MPYYFPADLLNEVSRCLRSAGHAVIVAQSGGSKTALATHLAENAHQLDRRVRRFQVRPSMFPERTGPGVEWPPSNDIRDALSALSQKESGSDLFLIEDIHLDAKAFHDDFWQKWKSMPATLRPLVVVTTRPHFAQVLEAERLIARTGVTLEQASDTSFTTSLEPARTHREGVVHLEQWRSAIFDMRVEETFGKSVPRVGLQLLRQVCHLNQEALSRIIDSKTEIGHPKAWTKAKLSDVLNRSLFKKWLEPERFPGNAQSQTRTRDRFLTLLSHRMFELPAIESDLDADLESVDLAQALRGLTYAPLHPDHARLLLNACRDLEGRSDLPPWVRQGKHIEPVLRTIDGLDGPTSMAILLRLAATELPQGVADEYGEHLASALGSTDAGLSWAAATSLMITPTIATMSEPARKAIADGVLALISSPAPDSERGAQARSNAVLLLARAPLMEALDKDGQRAVFRRLLDIMKQVGPHAGIKPGDEHSQLARMNAITVFAAPSLKNIPRSPAQLALALIDIATAHIEARDRTSETAHPLVFMNAIAMLADPGLLDTLSQEDLERAASIFATVLADGMPKAAGDEPTHRPILDSAETGLSHKAAFEALRPEQKGALGPHLLAVAIGEHPTLVTTKLMTAIAVKGNDARARAWLFSKEGENDVIRRRINALLLCADGTILDAFSDASRSTLARTAFEIVFSRGAGFEGFSDMAIVNAAFLLAHKEVFASLEPSMKERTAEWMLDVAMGDFKLAASDHTIQYRLRANGVSGLLEPQIAGESRRLAARPAHYAAALDEQLPGARLRILEIFGVDSGSASAGSESLAQGGTAALFAAMLLTKRPPESDQTAGLALMTLADFARRGAWPFSDFAIATLAGIGSENRWRVGLQTIEAECVMRPERAELSLRALIVIGFLWRCLPESAMRLREMANVSPYPLAIMQLASKMDRLAARNGEWERA